MVFTMAIAAQRSTKVATNRQARINTEIKTETTRALQNIVAVQAG